MGSVWDRFGVGLASDCGRFGIGLGSVWGRFGVGLGSVWDRFGIGLGSVWDRFGIGLGSKKTIKSSDCRLILSFHDFHLNHVFPLFGPIGPWASRR